REVGRGGVGASGRGRGACLPAVRDRLLELALVGAGDLRELLLGEARLLDLVLEEAGVVAGPGLELRVEVERDREGRGEHQPSERHPRLPLIAPERLESRGAPAADGHEGTQDGGAKPVRERDDQRRPAEVETGRLGRDHAEDRAGAGDEDEPEAYSQQESTPEIAGSAARQEEKRALDPAADGRDEERRREQEE